MFPREGPENGKPTDTGQKEDKMARIYNVAMNGAEPEKEYFYIGLSHSKTKHYRIVKVGTTKNLAQRKRQHRNHVYAKDNEFNLNDFEYLQTIKLSHSNTLRLEKSVKAQLRSLLHEDEIFEQNDRFVITHNEEIIINVTVNTKIYSVTIPAEENFEE